MTALTHEQQAALVRAVARRSRGAISLPRAPISRREAILLWHVLVAAYAPPQGRLLTPSELAKLRWRAWVRSAGHVALGEDALSLAAGLAVWRLAVRLGMLAERRTSRGLARAATMASPARM